MDAAGYFGQLCTQPRISRASEAFARRCVEVQDDVEQGWRYNPETGQATPDNRPPEPESPSAEDITLDMLAEHEERLCMLEITTNAV